MSKPKVYIDGKEGTTGLQIYDRLARRQDIDLLLIDEAKRKDPDCRATRARGKRPLPSIPARTGQRSWRARGITL